MEADISRHYPRFDFHDYLTGRRKRGVPVLSFRRLLVFVRHLPVDSSCADVGSETQLIRTPDQLILADLFRVMSGTKHWMAETDAERKAKADAAAEAKATEILKVSRVEAGKARIARRKATLALSDTNTPPGQ